ncbi:VOC family protein [Shimia ponticola]|uniref:VOC family protein n=1 Tax=Shimia ponticola TaxID=2582893 RepID=UPI0011BF7A16|nr:VOC family protein [Shimia ponticola]
MHLHAVTIVVPDYDAGLAFYVDTLGFNLIDDIDLGDGKRWVLISPGGDAHILLAKATTDSQTAAIGNQTGGRVGFFLHSDDFDKDYARMKSAGVTFLEEPRHEAYGEVVVFSDPWGNKWDLLQLKK